MNEIISKWSSTQAIMETTCPKCSANPGEPCRTPSGRKAQIHWQRGRAYFLKIGREEFNRRHQFFFRRRPIARDRAAPARPSHLLKNCQPLTTKNL